MVKETLAQERGHPCSPKSGGGTGLQSSQLRGMCTFFICLTFLRSLSVSLTKQKKSLKLYIDPKVDF